MSTVVCPAASAFFTCSSRSWIRRMRSATAETCSLGTITTPSSSPATRSPGRTRTPAALDRDLKGAERLLDRPARRRAAREHRQALGGQRRPIPDEPLEDDAGHAPEPRGVDEDVAEQRRVAPRAAVDHQHVAVRGELDGAVDRQVVRGPAAERERGTEALHSGRDRSDRRVHVAPASEGVGEHRRRSGRQRLQRFRIRGRRRGAVTSTALSPGHPSGSLSRVSTRSPERVLALFRTQRSDAEVSAIAWIL